jgi:5-methylcytosine-specific restriction endonuclease McrA
VLDDKFDKQTGICPYTGRHLILGKDASLDHIVPSSKGGTNDLENLQWVFHKANEMKWNYSEEEFLGLVREIFLYRFGA